MVREGFNSGREEFSEECNLDYISHYANHVLKLDILNSWVDFSNGYRHCVSCVENRIWMMPEYRMHDIPLIMFECVLRLLMSHFHLAMYESIGCGITSLYQMSLLKSGFIALCDEKDRLFFSIYRKRYHNGQVYFNTRNKRR